MLAFKKPNESLSRALSSLLVGDSLGGEPEDADDDSA